MRIVGGKYRNRRLHPPHEMEARPTTDFAKEGLFNVLQHSIPLEGIRVLDLFAGTGNISLEFLSRGAAEVISVEQDRDLFAFMQRTARELNENGWRMVKGDVFTFLGSHRGQYDVVFADPPFQLDGIDRIPGLVRDAGLLGTDGVLILEHHEKTDVSALPGYQRTRRYGTIHFSFFGA
ncbi:MAG: 16S rRNA (guanine(966)-N(2))-methyltransferase RsmD [Flavobacteriales bacterium]|nr:16S rRNA (guanine(966)-N(2))-methyltransferase RsmD [Flavobacteriales bacterium]HPF91425.1 16S rRNA (guanine(966)-N(2))-methyltransferase RsmD [Flavobacteriales bacterium]